MKKRKFNIDRLKRRLAGEALIHVYRLMHDVVLFTLNDRCLRWYAGGMTPGERRAVQNVSIVMDEQTQMVRTLYMRMIPRAGK